MKFDKDTFEKLIAERDFNKPLISIYIPTSRAGTVQEDRIRFKNALNEAAERLVEENLYPEMELDKDEARKFLSEGFDLLEKEDFWLHLSDGLAVFIGEDRFHTYVVPISFEPLVYIGNEFYTRKLHPIFTRENRFFLLALSQSEVRFFEVHKYHIYPVIIEDLVPEDLENALEKQKPTVLQSHTTGGSDSAVFHGQGGRKDQKNDDLKEFFRQVDKGLMEMLHDENEPMVIAAVDYLVPLYKEVSKYNHIVEEHISGNPDDLGPVVLHEKAWKIMQPKFQAKKEESREAFPLQIKNEKASVSVEDIVLAARGGRVETLYVNGETDPKLGEVFTSNENYGVKFHDENTRKNTCLLNAAAVYTWENGGKVYSLEKEDMPDSSKPLNAVFRY